MNNRSTGPAPLDNLTTMPALLTEPAVLQQDRGDDRIRPIHKWIFALAMMALMAALVLVR